MIAKNKSATEKEIEESPVYAHAHNEKRNSITDHLAARAVSKAMCLVLVLQFSLQIFENLEISENMCKKV